MKKTVPQRKRTEASRCVADVDGPWVDTAGVATGMIERCRTNWSVPIDAVSDEVLATFIRQKIALTLTVPEARRRLDSGLFDGTEIYEGELATAVSKLKAGGDSEGQPQQR